MSKQHDTLCKNCGPAIWDVRDTPSGLVRECRNCHHEELVEPKRARQTAALARAEALLAEYLSQPK
jgi:hypothetical protein